jgi:hypothetical protein
MTHNDATHDHMAAVRVMTTEDGEARPNSLTQSCTVLNKTLTSSGII